MKIITMAGTEHVPKRGGGGNIGALQVSYMNMCLFRKFSGIYAS